MKSSCSLFLLAAFGLPVAGFAMSEQDPTPAPLPPVRPPEVGPPTTPCDEECCWELKKEGPLSWLICGGPPDAPVTCDAGGIVGSGQVVPENPTSPTWQREWTDWTAQEYLISEVMAEAEQVPPACGGIGMGGNLNQICAGGEQVFEVVWNSQYGCTVRPAIKELTIAGYAETEVTALAPCSCLPGDNVTATAIGAARLFVGNVYQAVPSSDYALVKATAFDDNTWVPGSQGPVRTRWVKYFNGSFWFGFGGAMEDVPGVSVWTERAPFLSYSVTSCNPSSLFVRVESYAFAQALIEGCGLSATASRALVTSASASANCNACSSGPGGPPVILPLDP